VTRARSLGVRSAVIVSALLAGACFGRSELARGPCTLVVAGDEVAGARVLDAPYVVRPGGPDPGRWDLIFSGTGWHVMDVVFRHSSGKPEAVQFEGRDMASSGVGIVLERPGHWQFRLSDRVAGCVREFSVEAVP
jgi:hypothetical protein